MAKTVKTTSLKTTSLTIKTEGWRHTLGVFFAAAAALPSTIPGIDAIFHLGVTQSSEIAGIIGGVVILMAAIHSFLVTNGVLDAVTSAFKRNKPVPPGV